MVGVDVGVEDVGDSPAAPFGEFKIDLRLDGGIYDEGLIVGPDDVGESPLARAPYLEHFDLRARHGHLHRIPGHAPSFHPPFE